MKWYFWTICIFWFYNGYSQNLVPNPSFETYTQCPTGIYQFYQVHNWYQATNNSSADYFHICGKSDCCSVPNNATGNQTPKDGDAYIGLYGYGVGISDFREYVTVELTSILSAGKTYRLTFYISLSDTSMYGINRMGAFFSSFNPYVNLPVNTYLLDMYTPQIEYPDTQFLKNDTSWQKISEVYLAQGGEKFITIGNFYPDSSTNFMNVNSSFYPISYYYIDDVSVAPFPADMDVNVDTLTYYSVCFSDSSVLKLRIQNRSDTVLDFTTDSVTFITKVEVGSQIVQILETKVTDNSNNPVPGQALAIDSFMTIDLSFIDLSRIGVKHTITTTLQFDDDVNSQNDTTFFEITPNMYIGDVSVSPNIICPGEDVNLQAQNFVGEGKWEYSEDGTNWQLLSNNSMLIENPTDSIYYRFNVCDELFSSASLVEVVKEFRGGLSVSPLEVCKGEEVELDAINTIFQPKWQFKENGKSWAYLQSGTSIKHYPEVSTYYRVEICNSVYSDSILVEVVNVPLPSSFSDTVCKNVISTIEPFVDQDVEEILWFHNLDDEISFHTGMNYEASFTVNSVFYIQGKKNSCLSEEKAKVEIVVEDCLLQIPNIFTPNGDGINDSFMIGNVEGKEVDVKIFNRWEEEVASFKGNNDWDGGELPEGVYYYLVREEINGSSKIHKGKVTLLR